MDVFDPARIFHLGYVVPNMERALKTWCGNGAKVLVPPAQDPIQKVACCLIVYKDSVSIELIAPLPGTESPVDNRLKKGGGLDHVCLFADDINRELDAMRQNGGLVVVEPCYGVVFDRELAFVLTRMGLVVELMTRTAVGRVPIDPLLSYFKQVVRRVQT